MLNILTINIRVLRCDNFKIGLLSIKPNGWVLLKKRIKNEIVYNCNR